MNIRKIWKSAGLLVAGLVILRGGNVLRNKEPVLVSVETASEEAIKEQDWHLLLVNKWNPIPLNLKIELVEVPGGEMVDKRIYEPLMAMLNAAQHANLGPVVVSGYRTTEKQRYLMDEKVKAFQKEGYGEAEARELAEKWVAIPGTSEHQLGLAVDINGSVYEIYHWLQENSYKYGFIFRYPGEKTDKTGISEEVWHYRYVGIEAAKEIYKQGICLEEYLE